jgi:hypothetical protein
LDAPFHTCRRLSVLCQGFLVWTVYRQHPAYCQLACLASSAAQQHTHLVYSWLSVLSYTLPLPLEPTVQRSPATECAAVLGWMHITIGLLAPLLWEAAAGAKAFARRSARRAASSPPAGMSAAEVAPAGERGLDAFIFRRLAFLADGHVAPALGAITWVLAAFSWDLCALLAAPAGERMLQPPLDGAAAA